LRAFATDIRSVTERRAYPGRVVATQPRYADLHKLYGKVALGRFLTEQDEKQVANVAVLGSDVAEELFPGEDPLQKRIKIKDRAFEVVGVLKDRVPGSGEGEKYNGDVYIPLRSWRERVGQLVVTPTADSFIAEDVQLSQIVLTAADSEQVRFVAEA